ncbi:MAG: bifunctional [glutamine synthetase] adenylyltransferase/[glutamine synthetase]-adenylyl-L-tyrosine phosphorylase, partial [Caulobacteraceae bacterium]
AAQYLQLARAADGGQLVANTGEALALVDARNEALEVLRGAWTLQQALSQLLKIALEDGGNPESEPKALRALLARSGGARDFRSLKAKLAAARRAALAASRSILGA